MLEIRESADPDPARFEAVMPSGDGSVYAYHHAAQQRGETTHLVAFDHGVPAGHAVLDWAGCVDAAARAALPRAVELRNLHVGEHARDRGVGSALIAAAEQRATARDADQLVLSVGLDNPGAHRLYERLGYRDSGVRTVSEYRLPGTGEHLVEHNAVLVKDLPVRRSR